MSSYTDQLGRTITLDSIPKRIISTVPSQTEVLADLGLDDEVIGITKFCVHPENWRNDKTLIGGTKNIDVEKIRSLEPDLVIANKEENIEEKMEEISDFCPVWVSDVNDHASAMDMIRSIARMTGKENTGLRWIEEIDHARSEIGKVKKGTAAYFIWKNPWMTVGEDTFIHDMMDTAGFVNIFGDHTRYPVTDLDTIKRLSPEHILLSSEPYPFKAEHFAEFEAACPKAHIRIVDGEMFSWYGTRMKLGYQYLKGL